MKAIAILLSIVLFTSHCKSPQQGKFTSESTSSLTKRPANHQTRYYIDVHHLGSGNVTAEAVAEAHRMDLLKQSKYGVKFIKYWVSETDGTVFCLSESPNEVMVLKTHEEAHGLIPDHVYEVTSGEETAMIGNRNLYLDVHHLGLGNVTAQAVAEAHEKDLDVQAKYDVNFINYWVDENQGVVVCLSEAKHADHVKQTHAEAHGLIPDQIFDVIQAE